MNQKTKLEEIKDSVEAHCKGIEIEHLVRRQNKNHPINFKNIYQELETTFEPGLPLLSKRDRVYHYLCNWLETSKNDYFCPNCNWRFDSRKMFREHLRKIHFRIQRISVKKICPFCNRSFLNLERHIRFHTREKIFQCEFCTEEFFVSSQLDKHVSLRHRERQSYPCQICNKMDLFSRVARSLHIRYHHKNVGRTFDCPNCPKKFKTNYNMKIHMKIMHEFRMGADTRVACKLCDKTYDHPLTLKRHEYKKHLRTVSELICGICSKVFKRVCALNRHVRVHTTEAPFKCKVCAKSFKTDSNLDQHAKTHSQLRAFQCQSCNVSFKFRHHLQFHLTTLAHSDSLRLRTKVGNDVFVKEPGKA